MKVLIWALLMISQAAANTFVSRARNSGSYGLHACASACSNGVYIIGQVIGLDYMLTAMQSVKAGHYAEAAPLVIAYTLLTMSGSVGMHWVGVNYIEKGKRKVGA